MSSSNPVQSLRQKALVNYLTKLGNKNAWTSAIAALADAQQHGVPLNNAAVSSAIETVACHPEKLKLASFLSKSCKKWTSKPPTDAALVAMLENAKNAGDWRFAVGLFRETAGANRATTKMLNQTMGALGKCGMWESSLSLYFAARRPQSTPEFWLTEMDRNRFRRRRNQHQHAAQKPPAATLDRPSSPASSMPSQQLHHRSQSQPPPAGASQAFVSKAPEMNADGDADMDDGDATDGENDDDGQLFDDNGVPIQPRSTTTAQQQSNTPNSSASADHHSHGQKVHDDHDGEEEQFHRFYEDREREKMRMEEDLRRAAVAASAEVAALVPNQETALLLAKLAAQGQRWDYALKLIPAGEQIGRAIASGSVGGAGLRQAEAIAAARAVAAATATATSAHNQRGHHHQQQQQQRGAVDLSAIASIPAPTLPTLERNGTGNVTLLPPVAFDVIAHACHKQRKFYSTVKVLEHMIDRGVSPHESTCHLAIQAAEEVTAVCQGQDVSTEETEFLEKIQPSSSSSSFSSSSAAAAPNAAAAQQPSSGVVSLSAVTFSSAQSPAALEAAAAIRTKKNAVAIATASWAVTCRLLDAIVKVPDATLSRVTFESALRCCASVGKWREAFQCLSLMSRKNLPLGEASLEVAVCSKIAAKGQTTIPQAERLIAAVGFKTAHSLRVANSLMRCGLHNNDVGFSKKVRAAMLRERGTGHSAIPNIDTEESLRILMLMSHRAKQWERVIKQYLLLKARNLKELERAEKQRLKAEERRRMDEEEGSTANDDETVGGKSGQDKTSGESSSESDESSSSMGRIVKESQRVSRLRLRPLAQQLTFEERRCVEEACVALHGNPAADAVMKDLHGADTNLVSLR